MRGNTAGFGSIELLVKALKDEFPELDPVRLRAAVERAAAKAANMSLNTEGHRLIDMHLQRVEATEEATERAKLLRELAEDLEQRGDMDRALVLQLAAFTEAPIGDDIDALLRLAQVTQRTGELPLEVMSGLVASTDDAAPKRLRELATAWQAQGNPYRAADCLERVLAVVPDDAQAHDALELFYRANAEWSVLLDLLGRRALHVTDHDKAELLREMAVIYERELGDDGGALDAFRESDQLEPGHADVLDAIARLVIRLGMPDEEALTALEQLVRLVPEPKRRAAVEVRAADIAKNHDWDKAQRLYEGARRDDADLVPAIDGLATLLRDRGELAQVITLLVEGADRPALVVERSRWLVDAADFCVGLGDTERAKELYRAARAADPTNAKAGLALVELCWDTGSLVELAPILDELTVTTQDPTRLRGYLLQRSKVAQELGEAAVSRTTLQRAVELDSHDPATRRELADLMFENAEWAKARELIEGLLEDHEDLLQADVSVELHYRVAKCARELGDVEGAAKHAGVTLALAPDHREALLLRSELNIADPEAQLADELALANIAPPDEKGIRFAALGDRYAEKGDRATAREMYREALAHRPSDHLLLTKFLGLIADEGDWSYSFDLVHRLIDTENDGKVRARYRHLAAMIARDELDRADDARTLFEQAIDDDPKLFTAADELESMLGDNREALAAFYYRRLGHVRDDEGRSGERLRLWDRLGEVCLALGRRDDALVAFEVGVKLEPNDFVRRQKLAELYTEGDRRYANDAIAHHQAILRGDKRRLASYEALRSLYRKTGQAQKSRAVDDALAIVGMQVVDDDAPLKDPSHSGIDALFDYEAPDPVRTIRPLANEDWLALSKLDVDLQLSALFGLLAPAFAAERARVSPPPTMPTKRDPREQEPPPAIAKVLGKVLAAFGIQRPPVWLDREQGIAATLAMRPRDGALVPVLSLGKPALDRLIEDDELQFLLARQLADLRSERFARLLCPRASDLAQIVELAMAMNSDATRHSGKLLQTAHPAELDQALAIGARIRDRHLDPARAAVDWLAATERAADRIGFVVVGDLAACVHALEREPNAEQRILELVWSSITEDVFEVRSRLERWRPTTAMAATAGAQ
jgi:tetratricopeptide (TPR) repeat protein